MSDDYAKTHAYALRLLGFRSHSVAEMQTKMMRKGFSGESVQKVINELRSQGYLNDRRFAQELIRSLTRRKDVGRFYIVKKLKDAEISENTSGDVLNKEFPEEKEKELAAEAARNKAEEFQVKLSRMSIKQKSKLYRFLSSRGFSSDIISEVVDEMK